MSERERERGRQGKRLGERERERERALLPGHEHTIISEQRGPGCDIQTRQRESVLFARVGKTTVPATAVWPGRALMCSCRASRASHVVVSFDSLPLAQTTELGALCSDRGFGQVSELFSKGPPALGSECRPRERVPRAVRGRPCVLVRMSFSTTAERPLCTATERAPLP